MRTPPLRRARPPSPDLTPGTWKAGTSARSRHIWFDYSTPWLYVHEKDSQGQDQAKHLPYTRDDTILMAAAKDMYKRLLEARDAIATLPIEALGFIQDPTHGYWPVREELIHHITQALPKFQEDEEPEEKKMLHKIILEDEYFGDDDKGPLPKLTLTRSPSDPSMVEIDLTGDATVTLTYKELEEALAFLSGDSVIR